MVIQQQPFELIVLKNTNISKIKKISKISKIKLIMLLGTLFISVLSLLSARPATAHGYLVRSIPQDQATVTRAPSRVQLWFSESLEVQFSSLTVTDQTGKSVDLGGGAVAADNHARLTVALPPNLPNGAYIAHFRIAFAEDGHIVSDQIVFWVGTRTGSVTETGASQTADPVETAARGVSLVGALIAFGTLFGFVLVIRPAWRNPSYKAGGLAPRIMSTLYRLSAAGIGLALIGSVIWLMQQSTALFATDLGHVLSQGLWTVVATGTDFGSVWRLRVILLIGAGAILYMGSWIGARRPGWVYPLWLIATGIAAFLLATFSLNGHAAGSTLWPLITLAVDWLHLLANGAWIGGLVALIFAVRVAVLPLDNDARRLTLLAALRRFSPMAVVCVALLITTGLYSALASIHTPAQVVDSSYGRTLIAKMALVAPLLMIGWLHNRALTPTHFQNAERWIMRTLRAESVIGVTVIMVAGLLSATPPPAPLTARAAVTLPVYNATTDDLRLTLTPNPGGIGSNAYDVTLSRAGVPLDGARVWLTFAYPALGKRSAIIALDAVGGGQYSGGGGELTRAGEWQAWFDVLPADAPANTLPTRLALSWTVSAQSGTGTNRQPSLLNIASLLAILAVLAVWLIPIGRQRARQMQLDPLAVTVGVGALALTVIVFIGGGWYISTANADYEAAANPAPPHVNLTLPDQAVIRAGSDVFAAQCASCHNAANPSSATSASTPVPDSQNDVKYIAYVSTHNDSDVYNFLRGTSAHPYGKTISDADRWALEDYLRLAANATQELKPTP